MSSEAYSGSKSHRSEEHRRERRHRSRHDDNDSGGRDRDRNRDREDHASSRDRRRERDRRKDSKKRSRDDERREHSRSRRYSDSDSEDDDKDDKRRRRDSRREKSSNKRRKKSSRRSSRHSDSDSEYSSDYDRKRSNDKRKKKKKSSKSHSRPEKKDKKSAKTLAKKPDKSKLVPMGEPVGKPPDTRVNAEEDYFSYYQEFQIYLFREEGTCFNDIDTEDARAAFARFANEYNAGKLEEPYYTRTFSHEVIEESKTTKHSWGFKTTNAERRGLGDLQKGIRRQTEYNNNKTKEQQNPSINIRNLNSVRGSEVSCPPVESLGSASASASARRRRPTPEERLKERRADRRLKEHLGLELEELKERSKDWKERRLVQKREQSARIHGAHRDQEGAAAGMELSDSALFGDDDGRAMLGRSRQKKERRDERQKNRIQELQAKEEEKQKNMLKMLGLENLQGQKKIEIAPRK